MCIRDSHKTYSPYRKESRKLKPTVKCPECYNTNLYKFGKDSDQILVLDNGKLVEYGTHEKLMKKNGLYHKLFHIQQESLGWAV